MVTDTSIMSYRESPAMLASQMEEVFGMVLQARHPSSADIERLTGIPRTSVCARLRKLEKDGRIIKGGKKIDPFSGKTVYWYAIAPQGASQ